MPIIRNPAQIRQLITELPHKNEASFAWVNVLGAFSILPALRGLWFGANRTSTGTLVDRSGLGMSLSAVNTPTYNISGLIQHSTYLRAGSQAHGRVTATDIAITGALTAFAWVRWTGLSAGVLTGAETKWLSTGNQRSWALIKNAANLFQLLLSANGTGTAVTLSSTATWVSGEWFFVVGRYIPSIEASIFINGIFTDTVTGIPASLFNSTANLNLGAHDTGNYIDGDIAIAGLCAIDLPDYMIRVMYDVSRRLFGL